MITSPTLLALKAGMGKLGVLLMFLLKHITISLTLIIILISLSMDTIQAFEKNNFWEPYRDGTIKKVIGADQIIESEVTNFQGLESKWDKTQSIWLILESLWFIAMFAYLIFWINTQWMYTNFNAALMTILAMCIISIVSGFYYLNIEGATTVPRVLAELIPFKGIGTLFINMGLIIKSIKS